VAIPSWAIDLRYRRIFVSLTHLRHNHVSRNSDFLCYHLQITSDAKLNLMLGAANLSGVLVIGFDENIDMLPQLLDGVERGAPGIPLRDVGQISMWSCQEARVNAE
jgi:hypothetical protein